MSGIWTNETKTTLTAVTREDWVYIYIYIYIHTHTHTHTHTQIIEKYKYLLLYYVI